MEGGEAGEGVETSAPGLRNSASASALSWAAAAAAGCSFDSNFFTSFLTIVRYRCPPPRRAAERTTTSGGGLGGG